MARVRGSNHPRHRHADVRRASIRCAAASTARRFSGTAYAPFDPAGQALKNLSLAVPEDRLDDRRVLLASLDRMNSEVDRTGAMEGMDQFEQQAFNLVLGGAPAAFDLKKENPKTWPATARALASNCCGPGGCARRAAAS